VKVDLSNSEERGRFLTETAARSERILVLTEGVIPYLNPDEVASLAGDLRARPVFRYWIADYFSPETYRYRRRKGVTDVMKNAPFRFEPEDYLGFFREHGWQPRTMRYLVEEGRRLNRPIPLRWPLRLWIRVLSLFMSPSRRAAMGRFMGYVLFKPSETN
jgi:O-methyltransferase involved in polyketide biosynthesis